MEFQQIEQQIYKYVDQVKDLLSSEIWENILLDCTKNEILVLWLLYRTQEVNMTQIAEYIHAPLNTATGIISRMEKRKLISRQRSQEDKRVVTITLGIKGEAQIQSIIKEVVFYASKIMQSFSQEEIKLFVRMMDRVVDIMKEERIQDTQHQIVRKITIE
ncbi:MarR family winged helix-turn-helix transcriptional regulator [Anaerocolumna sp. MB42-C2]|uniref:MarR family winged helix-turn-helix transcriptional regulator n=1 Tax=Anaerocolumna sp. MB42-C2 TaxID=3070997 RepID=UPI0027E01668|nr:MarR family transcriptional regulator [Anaerocolumna sp. MB42-C2]WMJ90281.1 MarR family transcriptional regulator [Anaerocolumna sp. MB42-C2]